ncbi:MAG: protein kinase domain-containing protein [Gemmatimonadales bacterium]
MPEELDRLESVLAGRYAIEGDLGAGGMAVVYLARDLKHDRRVAIKVLRSHLAAAVGAERFLREVQITARLGHPNILLLIDSGTAGGLLYYVMPYVEGESLRRRLEREQRLPLADATRIAREVADALAYAHGLGVVHRDIKPENILLEAGHAVVSDFGIAHAVSVAGADRLTETGLVMGTPGYMSPEQAMGERDLDGRSDVFSLGCVLYEMLAGEPPFSGPTPQASLTRRLTEPAPRVSAVRDGIPLQVEETVRRALAREPGARLTAAQLAERLALDPTAARGPGRRARLALGAAAAVAVLVVGALLVSGPGGGTDRMASSGGAVASGFGRRLAQLTFGAGVEEWPAWSPDGASLAYVAETGGYKKLFLRTLATGAERQLTRGAADEIEPTWAFDGRTIALVRSNLARGKLEPTDIRGWYQDGGDIWTLDLASGRETQVVANAFDPAYSPDGRRLAFAARWSGPRRVWIADASGHNAQQVSTEGSEAVVHGTPRWSPDGAKLVFRRIEQTKSDIVVLDIASRATIRLTDDNVLALDPVWSPDGAFIYFSSFRGGGLNLWRVPVGRDGRPAEAAQQITTGAGDDGQATLDPEGRRLAFSILGYDSDLWRLPVDPRTGRATGEPQPVVGTTRVESRGAWSPDGRRIAFNSDRAGEMNIWVRSLGDGTDRQVTTGSGGDYQPNWSPDGRTIAFFSARAGHSDI